MKHLDAEHEHYLEELLQDMGLSLTMETQRGLLAHLDWVLEQNRTINLTSITEPFAAIRLHVVDSLGSTPEVGASPAGALLDLGTGGGFPGFPLALTTGRSAVLLDSVSKKVSALAGFLEGLPTAEVIRSRAGRAEELGDCDHSSFAVVTARAVSKLPALVELAAPWLGPGGVFIAMKAAIDDSELSRGDEVAGIVGLERVGRRRYQLPGGEEIRTAVTYRRCGESTVALPRRVGMAQKRPLA